MDYTLRIYVGFEYECPRGHRFFLSASDKIFKAPPNGIFKVEDVLKFACKSCKINHDLDLFYRRQLQKYFTMPCPCISLATVGKCGVLKKLGGSF